MSKYMLFPFDKIEKGSNIIIYGAGEIGRCLKEQIDITNFCNIICFLDKESSNIKKVDKYKCIDPIEYKKHLFDYILIASNKYKDEIYNFLIKLGIERKKIILLENKYDLANIKKMITPETAEWDKYYKEAEIMANSQFESIIKPFVDKFSLLNSNSVILDFACGRGRIANIIKDKCRTLICCDISEEAINYCKERFINQKNVICIVGEENKINIEDNSIDFIYSWDAMVHFNYRHIDRYLCEFFRILNYGGYVFIHHSNLLNNDLVEEKSETWFENIHCRSNVGKEDIKFIASKYGFEIICQETLDWGIKNLDCISILRKSNIK